MQRFDTYQEAAVKGLWGARRFGSDGEARLRKAAKSAEDDGVDVSVTLRAHDGDDREVIILGRDGPMGRRGQVVVTRPRVV